MLRCFLYNFVLASLWSLLFGVHSSEAFIVSRFAGCKQIGRCIYWQSLRDSTKATRSMPYKLAMKGKSESPMKSLIDRIKLDSQGQPRLTRVVGKGVQLALWVLAGGSIQDTRVRVTADSNRAVCAGRMSIAVDWRNAGGLLRAKTASFSAQNLDLRYRPLLILSYALLLPFSGRAWLFLSIVMFTLWALVGTQPSLVDWRLCVDDDNINKGIWKQLMQVSLCIYAAIQLQ